jgi:polysaccharide biosynthesis/export protein
MNIKPNTYNFLKSALLLMGLVMFLSSCNKYVLYSRNTPVNQNSGKQQAIAPDSSDERIEKILMPEDKISISIWNHDDLSIGSVHTIYNVQEETGKWLMIDAKGEVNLPQVGTVKLEGLTLREAVIYLEKIYSKFLQGPIVNIRILSNQLTIIGEVQRPGNYIFSTDNVRLVDLVGKASGFTDYAKTTKIKIIRGKESFVIDLTNIAFNETRVYPGDVVYIPPSGGKKFDRFASKLIPLASLLTALALVYNVSNN